MILRKYSFLAIAAVLLILVTACQPAATATISPEQAIPEPATAIDPESGYPGPIVEVTGDPMESYPGPAPQPGQALFNAYPPAVSDANMERGKFFFQSGTLTPKADAPGTADLHVEGDLPTPCNQIRVLVNPPDAQNRIVVDLYSVVSTDMACIQVIEPFAGLVATLGGYPTGTYPVVIDEQVVGELIVP